MNIGDTVVRKSYGKDITFRVIEIKQSENETIYVLKGINLRLVADSPLEDLEIVDESHSGKIDEVFNRKVNGAIKKILSDRSELFLRGKKAPKMPQTKELAFGRPGRILHVDGDSEYLEVCLKVYKQLGLDVVGKIIAESEQPSKILQLVKEVKPDIVVLTGHDSMVKGAVDYRDLNNYRNSRYFVEAVNELRNFQSSYDELVIFAGACQSCYENLLDSGANFASSPNRVLIHCLDPVFISEKVAYTNIEKYISIQEVLENTITGIKGIGGLKTRGKYREGYPKSPYA
jgi:spore coat assembly protein